MLISETLKFSSVLQKILTSSNLQSLEESLEDIHLTKILLHEALFGRAINGGGKREVSTLFIC